MCVCVFARVCVWHWCLSLEHNRNDSMRENGVETDFIVWSFITQAGNVKVVRALTETLTNKFVVWWNNTTTQCLSTSLHKQQHITLLKDMFVNKHIWNKIWKADLLPVSHYLICRLFADFVPIFSISFQYFKMNELWERLAAIIIDIYMYTCQWQL